MIKPYKIFIFLVTTLLFAVIPCFNTYSCLPELINNENMFLLFQKEIPDNDGLLPFYYSYHVLNSETPDPMNQDMHRNCKEWKDFTGGKATEKDIYDIEYNLGADAFVLAYKTGDWNNLSGNTFINWLTKPEQKAALEYFAFAKKVELVLAIDKDPWDEEKPIYISSGLDSIISYGEDKYQTSIPLFLKQRYAFQVVKLRYYNGARWGMETKALMDCYEKWLKGKPTLMADWGLLYYGMSLKNEKEKMICLLQAFDRTEGKKVFVYNYLSQKNLNQFLKSDIDAKTRSLAWAIKGMKNPGRGIKEIAEVYNNMPCSPYFKLLVGREINKLEDWILSPTMKGFNSQIKENAYHDDGWLSDSTPDTTYQYFAAANMLKDKQYLHQLRAYLERLEKTDLINRDFLRLSIVHLYHMENDYQDAVAMLEKIPHQKDRKMETQREIEKAISIMYSKNIRQPKVKAELEQLFEGLDKVGIAKKYVGDNFDHDCSGNVLSALYLLLSKQYQKNADIVSAGLLFRKADLLVNDYYGPNGWFSFTDQYDSTYYYVKIAYFDKYASPADMDTLLELKNKPGKTAFEKRLCPEEWPTDNACLDLKGTILLRQGKYEEALAAMEKIPDSFWTNNYLFKECLTRRNITCLGKFLPVNTGRGEKYPVVNKKAILKDIVKLRTELKNATGNENKAALYFMLGNCFYNMSYYGKDWMMFSYGHSYREKYPLYYGSNWWWYSFYPNNLKFGRIYYECSLARDMYSKSMALTKNKELTAQNMLMLSTCEEKAFDYEADIAQYTNGIIQKGKPKKFDDNWLKLAQKDYSQTEVMKWYEIECPDASGG